MIKIELNDGRVLDNDSCLGINLNYVEEIYSQLNDCGTYWLVTPDYVGRELLAGDVKRVYEDTWDNGHVRRALQDLRNAIENLHKAQVLHADASKFGGAVGLIQSAIGRVKDEW